MVEQYQDETTNSPEAVVEKEQRKREALLQKEKELLSAQMHSAPHMPTSVFHKEEKPSAITHNPPNTSTAKKEQKISSKKRVALETELKTAKVWEKVENTITNEDKLDALTKCMVELENPFLSVSDSTSEDVKQVAKLLGDNEVQLDKYLSKWFPFSNEELKRLGVEKRDVLHLLKLKLSSKGKKELLLQKIKDEKLKKMIKNVDADDVVVLYLLLFLLEELLFTGQLSPKLVDLVLRVLNKIAKLCHSKVKVRQNQIQYLRMLRDKGTTLADITGLNLSLLSAAFLMKLGRCDASISK